MDFAVHAKMYGKLQEGVRLFLADSVASCLFWLTYSEEGGNAQLR
jgi:hypothetical protein